MEHNGDYSPEAEEKRRKKREKVQRSRIRKRIADGTATGAEIAAIRAWEEGEDWALVRSDDSEPAPARPPRTKADTDQAEESTGSPWVALGVAGGFIAAFIGGLVWFARHTSG